MSSQTAQTQPPSKVALLSWLNKCLNGSGYSTQKIESLGTGVGYLFLLNHLHPGAVPLSKINKKPNN